MSDGREDSGVFNLIARVVDESERRMRPELSRLTEAVEKVRLEVHDLKIRREVDGTGKALSDVADLAKSNNDRISSLERWRAYVTGAVAVLAILAASFGVLAYQTLTDVEKDVAVLKSRGE